MKDIKTLDFHKFCVSIAHFPENFINSMSNAELLYWLCNYLENVVIPAINQNGESVEELQNLYVELKNYVDNYFNNLDVQEEINNKLNNMLQDGTLLQLIQQTYNNLKIINVKDFNAKGDGQTNDTTAIQTAINSNPNNAIYFPARNLYCR